MSAQLFGIVAAVAARHALQARTELRIVLAYDQGVSPFARVTFADMSGRAEPWYEFDLPASIQAPADVDAYRGLVELELAMFRGLIRRGSA